MANIFVDIGIVIIIASILAYIARVLKQPLIPAYIITGLLIGPLFGWITDTETIMLLSEIGVAFLLFIVGLEIDLKKLKSVALVSTLGGFVKIIILLGLGFIIGLSVGLIPLQAAYIGMIMAFSSTMVVLKLLSDRKELDSLHGRIVVGTLLMEDVVAIFILTILTTINGFSSALLLTAILKGIGLLAGAYVLARFIFPTVFRWIADSQELLFLVSLTVMFAFSLLFNIAGFSIAIGAFIAGVALGNLPYSIEIMGRVKSLRDFFATIFFVSLGMEIVISSVQEHIVLIIILSVVAVVLKPLLVMLITSLFGYMKRPAFLSAISLGQISEFGLIVAALGMALGHIASDIFTVAVVVAVVSITLTSYLLKFELPLYNKARRHLRWFEKLNIRQKRLGYFPTKKAHFKVILCGHNRIGYSIVERMRLHKKKLLVVDYNPEVITSLENQKIPCLYGDVADHEIIEHMNVKHADLLVSTVPDLSTNVILLHRVKKLNKNLQIFMTASTVYDALKLYEEGADYVIMPHFLGGEHVSMMMRGKITKKIITHKRLHHLQELHVRKNMGHEHPRPNR